LEALTFTTSVTLAKKKLGIVTLSIVLARATSKIIKAPKPSTLNC